MKRLLLVLSLAVVASSMQSALAPRTALKLVRPMTQRMNTTVQPITQKPTSTPRTILKCMKSAYLISSLICLPLSLAIAGNELGRDKHIGDHLICSLGTIALSPFIGALYGLSNHQLEKELIAIRRAEAIRINAWNDEMRRVRQQELAQKKTKITPQHTNTADILAERTLKN